MKTKTNAWALALILILAILATRVVAQEVHGYNFVPLVAFSLFSGAALKGRFLGYILPLAGLLLSDLYFHFFTSYPGFYGPEQGLVYLGFALVALLGSGMRSLRVAPALGYTLVGALIFFVVSNFGAFLAGQWGTGWAGLTKTYWMAIPFFRNSLLADMLGTVLIFGLYSLSLSRVRQTLSSRVRS